MNFSGGGSPFPSKSDKGRSASGVKVASNCTKHAENNRARHSHNDSPVAVYKSWSKRGKARC